jgi:hypothetical protein
MGYRARRSRVIEGGGELPCPCRASVPLYATDELSKDAYINASTALDRGLAALKHARADVAAAQRLSNRTELDVRVRQFCERARARFERCDDFDARRQFLLDHIERVVYHPRSVELVGSIPGDLTGTLVLPLGRVLQRLQSLFLLPSSAGHGFCRPRSHRAIAGTVPR